MNMVCRTCLSSSDEFESVYVKKLVNAKYTSIATMISACIGLEVSEYDSISGVVCKDCIDFIVLTFNYRQQCWKSHMILLGQLKEHYESSRLESQTCEMPMQQNPVPVTLISSDNGSSDDEQWSSGENIPVAFVEESPKHQNRVKILTSNSLGPKKLRSNRQKYDENGLPFGYEDMVEHTEIVKDEKSKLKMYRCSICNFNYQRIGPLRAHQEKIHGLQFKNDYECNECGKLFVSQKKLNFHVRLHDDNQFVCQFCGKKFRLNSELTIHVRRHTGDKPFGCDQCEFRSITKTDLATHKRSHTGEKPFKCYHCNAAFSTFSHRAAHVRQHSDERPFKCKICMTAYKSRGVYRSHMDSHDPKKSVICDICNHVSSNRKNYMRHVKHHRNKIPS